MKSWEQCQEELAIENGYVNWLTMVRVTNGAGVDSYDMLPLVAKRYAEHAIKHDRERIIKAKPVETKMIHEGLCDAFLKSQQIREMSIHLE